ncbi:MAG: hypothetical protein M0Z59_07925 [Nitrospiraceae bacterium]|nr:hypothetical protein [Nitrospiraceae bacterium]
MPGFFHYFYLLLSDEHDIEKAWEEFAASLNLACPVSKTAEECRMALGPNGEKLSLYPMGHIAVIELFSPFAGMEQTLSEIERRRAALEDRDIQVSLIGESVLFEGVPASGYPGGVQETRYRDTRFYADAKDESLYRRAYFIDRQAEVSGLREWLPRTDCLLFQAFRQMSYYREQRETFLKKRDELDTRTGEVLLRKGGEDIALLEEDLERLSQVYGVMANYGLMLRSAGERVESGIKEIERWIEGHVPAGDGFFAPRLSMLKDFSGILGKSRTDLDISLENARSAAEVVKNRIELARAREGLTLQEKITSLMKQNVMIQEESLTIGIAASFIEFVIVIYYGLNIWKTLADGPFHHMPFLLKFALILALSGAVTAGTHKAAKALKEKKRKDIFIWAGVIAAVVLLMVIASLAYS